MLRHRRTVLRALVVAALVAGCDTSVGLDGLQDAPLVEVLSTSATAGLSIPVRLRNASATRWGYNACASPLLQRREGDEWVNAPDPLRLCTAELSTLGAGETRTVAADIPPGASGTYRIRYRFLRSDGVEAIPVTGSFTVQ